MYGGCGRIFAAENPIFQSKNRFLADFAPGDFEEILAKSGRGGDPGGIRTYGLSLRSGVVHLPFVSPGVPRNADIARIFPVPNPVGYPCCTVLIRPFSG